MNSQKTGLQVASVIFGIVAIGHAVRLFNQTKVVLGKHVIPMELSWVALIIALLLCVWMWRLASAR